MKIVNPLAIFKNALRGKAGVALAIPQSTNTQYEVIPQAQAHFDGVLNVIEQHLTKSLNEVADIVHSKAKEIRTYSDIFLEFGISDKEIMHAGALAQMAISYANINRASDASGRTELISHLDRKVSVATAMALLKDAELRYKRAYDTNKAQLDEAFKKREESLAKYKLLKHD